MTIWRNDYGGGNNWAWTKLNAEPIDLDAGFRRDMRFADIDGDQKADAIWLHPQDASGVIWINKDPSNRDGWQRQSKYPLNQIPGVRVAAANIQFGRINTAYGRADYIETDPSDGSWTLWRNDCENLEGGGISAGSDTGSSPGSNAGSNSNGASSKGAGSASSGAAVSYRPVHTILELLPFTGCFYKLRFMKSRHIPVSLSFNASLEKLVLLIFHVGLWFCWRRCNRIPELFRRLRELRTKFQRLPHSYCRPICCHRRSHHLWWLCIHRGFQLPVHHRWSNPQTWQ